MLKLKLGNCRLLRAEYSLISIVEWGILASVEPYYLFFSFLSKIYSECNSAHSLEYGPAYAGFHSCIQCLANEQMNI